MSTSQIRKSSGKSNIVKLCLIIVPLFFTIAILFVGYLFWDAWERAPAKKILSPAEIAANQETNRLTLLTLDNPPTHNGIGNLLKSYQERLPLSEDLLQQLDQVEQSRCERDPHLAKALRSHQTTPLAGVNPPLRKHELENRSVLYSMLLEDYAQNSVDSELVKSQMAPLFKRVLNTKQVDRIDLLPELEQALTSSSDPLLAYLLVLIRESNRLPIALQAMESIKLRPVHAYIRMQIARLAIEVQVPTLLKGKACDLAIQSVSEFFRRYSDIPACLDVGIYYLEWFYFNQNEDAVGALTSEMFRVSDSNPGDSEIPEMVLSYCLGCLSRQIATTHRGVQFVHEVSPDQMQLFESYIQIAAGYMLKAWLNDPNRVLFATDLMNIEMRAGGTGRSVDQWFRHALSSQLDFPLAIERYYSTCEIKWGGSNEKLAWFASKLGECVEIESDLFAKMHTPAMELFLDNNRERRLSDPSLVKSVAKIVDYLREHESSDVDPRIHEKLVMIVTKVLWDGAEFERLHWFLQRYSHLTSEQSIALMDLNLGLVKDLCQAVQADTRKAWQAVHRDLFLRCQSLETKDTEKLAKILARLDEMAKDEPSKKAIARCNSLCEQVSRYLAGDQVKLNFNPASSNWIIGGQYQLLDDDAIEFTTLPHVKERLLTAVPRFSLPYRIEATIEMTLNNADPFGIALQTCSMSMCMQNNQSGMQVRFVPSMGGFQWDRIEPGYFSLQKCLNYGDSNRSTKAQIFIEMTENTAIAGVSESDFEMVNGNFKNDGLIIIGREMMAKYPLRSEVSEAKYKISNVLVSKLY